MKKIMAILFLAAIVFTRSVSGENISGGDLKEAGQLAKEAIEVFNKTGKYEEAKPLAEKALEIRERLLGREHVDVASGLDILAWLCSSARRYKEAEPLYRRALEIREKILGKEHHDVALSLNHLGILYRKTGRYAEAEQLYKRSIAIYEGKADKDSPNLTTTIGNLAYLYSYTGKYADAEPLYKRVLEIKEKKSGREHPDVAKCLENLADIYQNTGRYSAAEPLYKRALGILEKTSGKEHPDVAGALNELTMVYYHSGRYTEAEALCKRALEISRKKPDNANLTLATSLENLGQIYDSTGKLTEAEQSYIKAIEIREKALGNEHTQVASCLGNLASLYFNTGKYTEAELLHTRAMLIYTKALENKYPNPARLLNLVSASLNNLVLIYYKTGRYPEIELLHNTILKVSENLLGKEHPLVATNLNNLAEIYRLAGRYAEAEPLYKTALEIREKALGKNHPDVASSITGMARLYAAMGKHQESHQLFKRAISINESVKEESFLLLPERQKLGYIKQHEGDIFSFITHSALYQQSDAPAVTDTFNTWIAWKGAVMETQGRYLDAVLYSSVISYSGSEDIGKKFEELTNVRREMAKLQFSKPENMPAADHKAGLLALQKRKDSLESELNQLSRNFSFENITGKVDIKSISGILPGNSIYLDFAKVKPYDFTKDDWGKPRYLLFALMPDKEPVVKLIDIADAGEVDGHISAYLKEMNKAKTAQRLPDLKILNKEAKAVYQLIMKPAELLIKGKKVIFVSPDGNLNLIPFEVLVASHGKYLVEDYLISYVAAGRDITRFADTTSAEGESIIMADPDYSMGLKEIERVRKQIGFRGIRMGGGISKDAIEMSFGRLPDTKQEADSIGKILKTKLKLSVHSYQDKQAVEEALFQAEHPRILHLATHGYFLKEEEIKDSNLRGVTLKLKQGAEKENILNIENPMLRSGIVLAGVNSSLKEGRDDGMVSAEKIMGLKLKGTELVVLSACETGVGDVQSGEGVFGLKRAFILSGAKTLVMSLWSVPSKETTELMTDFYSLMSKGRTKAEALREAKLKMLRKNSNPFYWGAFIMTGNPE